MATSKLPLLVSSTVAVVSTRVEPLMLPPTMSEAPTSEMTAPKPGHDRRQHGQARLLQQGPDHLGARGAQGQHLETELLGHLLDGGQREPDDDGSGDHELGQDHRRGRVEQLEKAEGAVPPEHDRHEEADDHRRQPHARY